eukprot:GHVS01048941.1.p1 GENE.GHVS01048941.1~~GHVS01048941.1.p1  ORF type:complete len:170 (+),score=23.28 GHVS01048941.1:715-1224(+)
MKSLNIMLELGNDQGDETVIPGGHAEVQEYCAVCSNVPWRNLRDRGSIVTNQNEEKPVDVTDLSSISTEENLRISLQQQEKILNLLTTVSNKVQQLDTKISSLEEKLSLAESNIQKKTDICREEVTQLKQCSCEWKKEIETHITETFVGIKSTSSIDGEVNEVFPDWSI